MKCGCSANTSRNGSASLAGFDISSSVCTDLTDSWRCSTEIALVGDSGFPVRLCSRAGLRKRPVKRISANPVVDVLVAGATEAIAVDAVADVPAAVTVIAADEASS